MSLLVMLNLQLVFTFTVGIDHYSLYSLRSLEPTVRAWYGLYALAGMNLAINCLSVFFAYYTYKSLSRGWSWLPFKFESWAAFYRYTFVIGVPVAVAMLPALVLATWVGKSYNLIVGCLLVGALGMTAICKDDEVNISPNMARFYFTSLVLAVGGLLTVTVQWFLAIYGAEQVLYTGNGLWQWQVNWEVLGYSVEEFPDRMRGAMLVFTVATCAYMVTVVGGSMLFSFVRRMDVKDDAKVNDSSRNDDVPQDMYESYGFIHGIDPFTPGMGMPSVSVGGRQYDEASGAPGPYAPPAYSTLPAWGVEVLKRLGWRGSEPQDYIVVFDGTSEVGVTARQYESLLMGRERILSKADLLVDKAAADVYTKSEDAGSY